TAAKHTAAKERANARTRERGNARTRERANARTWKPQGNARDSISCRLELIQLERFPLVVDFDTGGIRRRRHVWHHHGLARARFCRWALCGGPGARRAHAAEPVVRTGRGDTRRSRPAEPAARRGEPGSRTDHA